MNALLRAEFRKLFTIRSTYVITIIALLIVGFFAFYVAGYRGNGTDSSWMMSLLSNVGTSIAIFPTLVAILLMGHEYRYNTIMYTLTSANNRSKVLLAKMLAAVSYTLLLLVVAFAFGVFALWLGTLFSPNSANGLIAPEFFWSDVWTSIFFIVAYSLVGLLLIFIFRHLVGAIAALFILPTIEGLLGILLKENTKYLPLSSLEQVATHSMWTSGQAAMLFTAYLVGAWIVAWVLFKRRDAN